MEKRTYGKANELLSIIGFGGIIVTNEDQQTANRYVDEAIDAGINYFDVAPSYGDAQEKLGPALEGKRQNIFLACKTEKRTAKEAEEALYDSLKKLKTDYFDLYQLHAVSSMEEAETVLGPNGALEVFTKAKERGLIRHIGFSAHSEEAAIVLMDRFDFESVLFPLNWASVFNRSFGCSILEKAIEKNVTRLALKAMAKSYWEEGADRKYPKCWYEPIEEDELSRLALRYTLSQSITAAIPPGDIRLFRRAVETAASFKPTTEAEEQELRRISKELKPLFPITK